MCLPTYRDLIEINNLQSPSISPDQVLSKVNFSFADRLSPRGKRREVRSNLSKELLTTSRTKRKSNLAPNNKRIKRLEPSYVQHVEDDEEVDDDSDVLVKVKIRKYDLQKFEFLPKEKWTSPAACMDQAQRKTLLPRYKTIQQMFVWYSQRPGKEYKDWPAQKFVLLQLTDINGVGKKEVVNARRKKPAAIAFGRPQGLEWFDLWKDSFKDGDKEGTGDFTNHSTSNTDTLIEFWKVPEDQFSTTEATRATQGTVSTNRSNGHLTKSSTLNPSQSKRNETRKKRKESKSNRSKSISNAHFSS
jgi:hypothetical protein